MKKISILVRRLYGTLMMRSPLLHRCVLLVGFGDPPDLNLKVVVVSLDVDLLVNT